MLLCTHVFFSFVSVLRECKNVELSFSDVTCKSDLLKDSRKGTIYLTPYRVRAPDCSRHHRCVFGHISVTVLSCPWRSWCLWIATPRTAWAQPCSPITWWKAAASSSRSLQPTTLKGHCPLSLVVCVPFVITRWFERLYFCVLYKRWDTFMFWCALLCTSHEKSVNVKLCKIFFYLFFNPGKLGLNQ